MFSRRVTHKCNKGHLSNQKTQRNLSYSFLLLLRKARKDKNNLVSGHHNTPLQKRRTDQCKQLNKIQKDNGSGTWTYKKSEWSQQRREKNARSDFTDRFVNCCKRKENGLLLTLLAIDRKHKVYWRNKLYEKRSPKSTEKYNTLKVSGEKFLSILSDWLNSPNQISSNDRLKVLLTNFNCADLRSVLKAEKLDARITWHSKEHLEVNRQSLEF